MSASVSTLGQLAPAVGKKSSERLAAHDDMRYRQVLGATIPIGGCEADQVYEIVVDRDADFVDEQCGLRHQYTLLPQRLKGALAIEHGGNPLETIDFAGCTGFQRNGFQAVSLFGPTNTPAIGSKTSENLCRHGYTRLKPRLMLLAAKGRQFSPKKQSNYVFLDCLNTEAGYEKTGERFRLGELRRSAVTVVLHFRQLSTFSSRAVIRIPRESRRPCAGMVGPSPLRPGMVAHLSFPSVRSSLSPFISVAGNGDSNVRFGPLGNVFAALRKIFGDLRKSFGAWQPGRSFHV